MNKAIRKTYSNCFKLSVVVFANNNNVVKAAKKYNVHHSLIIKWKKKEKQLRDVQELQQCRGRKPQFPVTEEYVVNMSKYRLSNNLSNTTDHKRRCTRSTING